MIDKIIRLSACIGVVFLAIKFINAEQASATYQTLSLTEVNMWLALVCFSIFIFVLLAFMFQVSMKVIDVNLPLKISFMSTSMNTFFNTVLPMKGGLWIRGAYLKRYFNVPWKNYLFVVSTSQIMQIGFLLGMLAIALLLDNVALRSLSSYLIGLPIEIIALSLIALSLSVLLIIRTKFGKKILTQLIKGLALWSNKPAQIGKFVTLVALLNIVTCLRFWLSFTAVGHTLSLNDAVIIYCLLAIGLSWAFTPGNIGVQEAATVFISAIFGVDISIALAASIVDRAASMLVILLIGGFAAYRSSRPID
ncbi:MAG: flippase-like domain-containing protein [Arenicella sp.]|nr:flippase-like domain-containing protein [Arenicella sp.]